MDCIEKINNFLLSLVQKLNNIINDLKYTNNINFVIKNIEDLIKSSNQIIEDNKINLISMQKNFNEFISSNNFNIHKTQIYPDGKYIGEFKNGMRDGKGIFYFNDGARYEGDYKCDKREGKGILYYPNGNIYQGDYKNNKKDGQGIMYYNNGNRAMGNYANGLPVGKHLMLDPFGNFSLI